MWIPLWLVIFAGCPVTRDANGRIHRSTHAKLEFRLDHPCPSTGQLYGRCPGYVIDHMWPLCAGGCDSPANMQWQALTESKVKDQWERSICKGRGDD